MTVRKTVGVVLRHDRAGVPGDRVLIRGRRTLIGEDEGQAGAGGRRAGDAAGGLAGGGCGAVPSIGWMP